jgi:hypothetical protein
MIGPVLVRRQDANNFDDAIRNLINNHMCAGRVDSDGAAEFRTFMGKHWIPADQVKCIAEFRNIIPRGLHSELSFAVTYDSRQIRSCFQRKRKPHRFSLLLLALAGRIASSKTSSIDASLKPLA